MCGIVGYLGKGQAYPALSRDSNDWNIVVTTRLV